MFLAEGGKRAKNDKILRIKDWCEKLVQYSWLCRLWFCSVQWSSRRNCKKNKKIKKFLSFFEKNDEECCQQIRAQAVKRLCTLFGPRCLVHMRKRWTNFQTCWVSHATFWIELPWEERHPDWSLECAAETLKTRPVWGLKFPSLAKKILWDFPVALDHSATVQCALKD